MKVRITALKSTSWPSEAKVGDVVELGVKEIPGWALGKCVEVEGDDKAKFTLKPGAEKKEAEK